jgi:TonB family protein
VKIRTVLCLSVAIQLAACATSKLPEASAAPHQSPDTANRTPRKLPKMHFVGTIDLYPATARSENLSGRVFVEFLINQAGDAFGERIVAADAGPGLQTGALSLLKAEKFDVSAPGFDFSDSTPFRVTIRFCLGTCTNPPYPGTEDIRVIVPPQSNPPKKPLFP